jgi:branched-subunit amino acid ABC-type transport system permease component
LPALGLSVVFGMLGVVDFAHGAFPTLGGLTSNRRLVRMNL